MLCLLYTRIDGEETRAGMKTICAWCGKTLGWKQGTGVSHGICPECREEHFTSKLHGRKTNGNS